MVRNAKQWAFSISKSDSPLCYRFLLQKRNRAGTNLNQYCAPTVLLLCIQLLRLGEAFYSKFAVTAKAKSSISFSMEM